MSARLIFAGVAAAALLGCNAVDASNADAPAASGAAAAEPAAKPVPVASVSPEPASQAELIWSQDPTTKCRFVAPRSLGTGPTTWTGACSDGKANGLGMLRRRDGGQAGAAFYGEMRVGVPVIGAIDHEGYVVGKFVDGDLVQDGLEPQVAIDSFLTAAKAARSVATIYHMENNPASAKFYSKVAEQLDQQIE